FGAAKPAREHIHIGAEPELLDLPVNLLVIEFCARVAFGWISTLLPARFGSLHDDAENWDYAYSTRTVSERFPPVEPGGDAFRFVRIPLPSVNAADDGGWTF